METVQDRNNCIVLLAQHWLFGSICTDSQQRLEKIIITVSSKVSCAYDMSIVWKIWRYLFTEEDAYKMIKRPSMLFAVSLHNPTNQDPNLTMWSALYTLHILINRSSESLSPDWEAWYFAVREAIVAISVYLRSGHSRSCLLMACRVNE